MVIMKKGKNCIDATGVNIVSGDFNTKTLHQKTVLPPRRRTLVCAIMCIDNTHFEEWEGHQ